MPTRIRLRRRVDKTKLGNLGDIARARGMTQLARDTGLSRESLSGERAPSSDTLFKVIHAMGFKLSLELLAHVKAGEGLSPLAVHDG